MLKILSWGVLLMSLSQVSYADQFQNQYMQIKSVDVHEEPIDQNTLLKIRQTYKVLEFIRDPSSADNLNPLPNMNPDPVPGTTPPPTSSPGGMPRPTGSNPGPFPGGLGPKPGPFPLPFPSNQDPISDATRTVDAIINIGSKIWEIFKASEPKANLTLKRANALPSAMKDWTDMENWTDVQAKQYSVSYKNGFNSEVVTFKLLMTYAYNGSFHGAGKYLNQVGFLVNQYYVAPFYELDAISEVTGIQNVGTAENPIASMEMNMIYNVSNKMAKNQNALNFYLKGDGEVRLIKAQ